MIFLLTFLRKQCYDIFQQAVIFLKNKFISHLSCIYQLFFYKLFFTPLKKARNI